MDVLFDQSDVEELLFDKLSKEFSPGFAEYMFEAWPEIIEDISKEIINYSDKLIEYAIRQILKRAAQLKRLEFNNSKKAENTMA